MNYYTKEDFNRIKKIDAHFHANAASDKVLKHLKSKDFKIFSINCDVPYAPYPTIDKQQEIIQTHQKNLPGLLAYASTISLKNWDSPNWGKETIAYLDFSFSKGATAVKFWKNIGMECQDKEGNYIQVDDPRFDKIIDHIRKRGYPLLGHIGEPKNCWLPIDEMTVNNDRAYFEEHPEYHMYHHPNCPSYERIISARDKMLLKNPDLTYIGCHLGSQEWSIDEVAKMFDKHANYKVDLAHRICHLQYQSQIKRDEVRDFIIKYQDRILYGTDIEVFDGDNEIDIIYSAEELWKQDWKYFTSDKNMKVEEVNGVFTGLQLPKEVVNKIYRKNAERWLPGFK